MKILSGLIYHESNTFNPIVTGREQFVFLEGDELLSRLASTKVFRDVGAEVVPAVYAMALSSGVVDRNVYDEIKEKLLTAVVEHDDIDGVWLHLHGAMTVEGLGSAEEDLLESIRTRTGSQMPIAVTLDPHGNIGPRLVELSTVLRSYRTIPHVDQPEIERRTAQHLLDIIEGKVVGSSIAYRRIPFALSGEKALSSESPLKEIHRKLDEVEAIPGILDASVFIGFAWADVPHNAASVVVIPESDDYRALAEEQVDALSDYILERYSEFEFQSIIMSISETMRKIASPDVLPLIISDSGDNTTGGAAGISTVLLREILQRSFNKAICVTTVWDSNAARYLDRIDVGNAVELSVGAGVTDYSGPVKVEGVLKAKGDLLGYMSSEKDKVGRTYTVAVGSVDVVITDIGGSFVTRKHFEAAGLQPEEYDVIVLKQGYLFPDLEQLGGEHILCITPGATYQLIDELPFENVDKDVYARRS